MDAMAIAGTGLQASLTRLAASAANIANANAAGAVPGNGPAPGNGAGPAAPAPYRPLRAETAPLAGGGVTAQLVPATPGYVLAFDPSARWADAQGMVARPAVNIADELVGQLAARQDYLANLAVLRTARDMERSTFQLWG